MKKVAALLALALVSAALVACGDDDGTTTTDTGAATEADAPRPGEPIDVEADPNGGLAYTTDQITIKAGNASIEFNNPQPATHDVVIEDANGKEVARTQLIAEGFESVSVPDLKAGQYTFYCSVPGHREGGMEGTLTVQ